MSSWWCMVAALVCAGAAAAAAWSGGDSMKCHRRYYRTLASQTDSAGRRCWDTIDIKSCRGRCDSREISDWQFPYKKSHHPVCVHGARRPVSVMLRNCDPDVDPGTHIYHYMEAKNCKCQTCSSEDTSCEWLPPNATELGGLFTSDDEPLQPLQPLDPTDDDDELD